MSSAAQRAKRREEVDYVYGEVTKAAAWGGLTYGLAGVALLTLGHYTSPIVRRQTLAFKGFITMGFVCTGLVLQGESALIAHEYEVRKQESRLRREARLDLARRGIVGTETEIAKWQDERAARLLQEQQQQRHHEGQQEQQISS